MVESRWHPTRYRRIPEEIDQYRQRPPPSKFAKKPEQDLQAGKHLRCPRMFESTIKRKANALAPHQQHDDHTRAEAQSADLRTGGARDGQQSRHGHQKVNATISDTLSGKEAPGDHRAANNEKKPFARGERSYRSPQLTRSQQPPADGDT